MSLRVSCFNAINATMPWKLYTSENSKRYIKWINTRNKEVNYKIINNETNIQNIYIALTMVVCPSFEPHWFKNTGQLSMTSHKGGRVITSANSSSRDLCCDKHGTWWLLCYFCYLLFCFIWCMLLYGFPLTVRHTLGFFYALMHMHTLEKRGLLKHVSLD